MHIFDPCCFSSDLPGVNPATNDRMILYYCLMTKVDRSYAIVRYFPGRVVTTTNSSLHKIITRLCIIISSTCVTVLVNLDDFFNVLCMVSTVFTEVPPDMFRGFKVQSGSSSLL
jgi:hypothetical protein